MSLSVCLFVCVYIKISCIARDVDECTMYNDQVTVVNPAAEVFRCECSVRLAGEAHNTNTDSTKSIFDGRLERKKF